MIEGARWRRWVFFHMPLTLFMVGLLFPFYWMIVTTVRPDSELYRPWNAANYTPFWTMHPTLEHIRDLLTETLFSTWIMNTMLIATASPVISMICGLFAGYALSRLSSPFSGRTRTSPFLSSLVPQTRWCCP